VPDAVIVSNVPDAEPVGSACPVSEMLTVMFVPVFVQYTIEVAGVPRTTDTEPDTVVAVVMLVFPE
jgi:hypothetical protein